MYSTPQKASHNVSARAGSYSVLISKQSVKELGLKAQDEKFQLVEIADPIKDQLIYKVVRLGI